MSRILPVKRGDFSSISIPEDIYQSQLRKFQFSLIGRLILLKGDKPWSAFDLKSRLQKIWKFTRDWNLISLGKVGTPLKIDGNSLHGNVGHFARVLIEIDMAQSLQPSVMIDRGDASFFVDLHYECLPLFCSACQIVGHATSNCRAKSQLAKDNLKGVGAVTGARMDEIPNKKGESQPKGAPSTKEWVVKAFSAAEKPRDDGGSVPVANAFDVLMAVTQPADENRSDAGVNILPHQGVVPAGSVERIPATGNVQKNVGSVGDVADSTVSVQRRVSVPVHGFKENDMRQEPVVEQLDQINTLDGPSLSEPMHEGAQVDDEVSWLEHVEHAAVDSVPVIATAQGVASGDKGEMHAVDSGEKWETSAPLKRTYGKRKNHPVKELRRSERLNPSGDEENQNSTNSALAEYVIAPPDTLALQNMEKVSGLNSDHSEAFKPEVLGIIEPRARFDKIVSFYWRSLNMVPIFQNNRGLRSSNIWIFVGKDTSATVLHSSDQCVVINFVWRSFLGVAVVVHGSSSYLKRRQLWDELNTLSGKFIILGDFNAIRGSHERRGKSKSSPQACNDFNNFIGDLDLTEVESNGLFFSWSSRRFFPAVTESKIDRALVSKDFHDAWSTFTASLLPRNCSDHSPLVVFCKASQSSGPRPFRFWNMWTSHASFLSLVRESWKEEVHSRSKIRVVMIKMKRLKAVLKDWNATVFGNFNIKIDDLGKNLEAIQEEISLHSYSDERMNEEIAYQADINNLLLVESSHLQQQSRIDWLNDGDRNTKFFHARIQARRAKAAMDVMSINGELVSDLSRIADHVVNYFNILFSDSGECNMDLSLVDKLIPQLITNEQAQNLTTIPSMVEVHSAVLALDANSAAGPDGYTGKFFHESWDIITVGVHRAVVEFFSFGILSPGLNSSFLVLIPKKERALMVEEFRPIALSNFLFKIFTKVLATRLNAVAAKIVTTQQYGFIQGRHIHEAIFLASEGVNTLNRTHAGRNMAIKVDITKAFDTLQWPFLSRVLRSFGFPAKFCSWITGILTSARLSVLINGSPCGYFECSRGVRQGDPLSPLLFGIAEEMLSYLLSNVVLHKSLKPMSYSRGFDFTTHILYADDVFNFCQATKSNVKALKEVIDVYAKLSGQLCNRLKSRVFYGVGVKKRVCRSVASSLGFTVGSFPTIYLGVPLFVGIPRVSHIRSLADKILLKFNRWNGHVLSMAGRLCLIKSVITSSAIHSMMVYAWPVSLVKKLDAAARNFLWKGDINVRSYTSVNWARTCAIVEEGGLGVSSFKEINKSLLMKLAWNLINVDNSAMQVIRSRFMSSPCQGKRVACSSIWPRIRNHVQSLVRESFCIIGCGSKVDFWHDNWLGFTSSFVANYPDIMHDILRVPITSGEDERVWTKSLHGTVTAKLARLHTRVHFPTVKWGRWIWNSCIPIRRSLVNWWLLLSRLPTMDSFHGFIGPTMCVLCRGDKETMDHLFWHCPLAKMVWRWIFDIFHIEEIYAYSIHEAYVQFMNCTFSSQLLMLWKTIVVTAIWSLWTFRNKAIYEELVPTPYIIISAIRVLLRELAFMRGRRGFMKNNVGDLLTLKALKVNPCPAPPQQIISVSWRPPPTGWIKINTDGSSRGAPGVMATGGVFRRSDGSVFGCFHTAEAIGFAFLAELLAVLVALEWAHSLSLDFIWLEADSIYVVNLLSSRSLQVPWILKARWKCVLDFIDSIHFCVSHIYREGNSVADILASSIVSPGFWFSSRFCSSSRNSPLKHLQNGVPLPTRRLFCSGGVLDDLRSEFESLMETASTSVVALKSYFSHSSSSPRVGTGVFVHPKLIVTSAHVVGCVSGEHCEVGRTAAITKGGEAEEDSVPPPCRLGYDVGWKELPLLVMTRHEGCDINERGIIQMKCRAVEDTSPRTEWMYPLGDEFGWARYGGSLVEEVIIVPGSPWFSPLHEVVGIASTPVGDETAGSVGGFVVPPPRIRAVLDYARGKGRNDPLVMDRWIKSTTVDDDDDDERTNIGKEGFMYVPAGFVVTMYLPMKPATDEDGGGFKGN
ncbi:hypothetical protein C2S51_001926 [Perilla frutescens var. frutescens]|nr:hypothetical protein C2S51_001926 [Perilla frutescens var. frutescens]